MIRTQLIIYLVFFTISTTTGQVKSSIKDALNQLQSRGEIYFSFPLAGPYSSNFFSSFLSIVKIKNDSIYAYANEDQFKRFIELTISFHLLTPPSMYAKPLKPLKPGETKQWQNYPTYTEYITMMEDFSESYPLLCELIDIGESVGGKKILVIKISDDVQTYENEPAVFYTSTMHGNEGSGYVLMLRFIDYLLNNYNTSNKITFLINNTVFFINPLANPDGLYFTSDTTIFGAKRFNLNNVDLNRNFPDPEDGDHPDGYPWQPETEAMMNFMQQNNLTLSANFHDGTEVVNYPWDTWKVRHADDAWYIQLSREYADTVHKFSNNSYMTEFNNGITNGYDWYTLSGGRQDYVNYFLNSREVTIELSNTPSLEGTELDKLWEYNKNSLINYAYNCLYGIKGKVLDKMSGKVIRAKIMIEEHDKNNSHVFSNESNGTFYRLIQEGNYNLVASAPNYIPASVNLQVSENDQTNILIELSSNLNIYPNPFADILNLPIQDSLSENVRFKVYDMNGRLIIDKNLSINGPEIIKLDLKWLNNGIYALYIQGQSVKMKSKIVKVPLIR